MNEQILRDVVAGLRADSETFRYQRTGDYQGKPQALVLYTASKKNNKGEMVSVETFYYVVHADLAVLDMDGIYSDWPSAQCRFDVKRDKCKATCSVPNTDVASASQIDFIRALKPGKKMTTRGPLTKRINSAMQHVATQPVATPAPIADQPAVAAIDPKMWAMFLQFQAMMKQG